jgi:hypothetical protein
MKRTTVVLDEELLEGARRALGEKTNSGAITKALEKVVRQSKFQEAYRKWEELARTEGVFHPDYLKEKSAKSVVAEKPKKRVSAHQVRERRPGRNQRGTR